MDITITFRHTDANPQLMRLIENQIPCLNKFRIKIIRLAVVVDVVGNADKLCHISLRATDKVLLDVYEINPGVVSAVTSAFDAMEDKLHRQLAHRKGHHSRTPPASHLKEEDMLVFEEINSVYPVPSGSRH